MLTEDARPAARRRAPLATAVRPVLEGLEGRQLFAATLTVTNPFILPGSDQVIFNQIGDKTAESPTNVVHAQQAITLTDTGTDPLTITSLTLSGPFAFVTAPALPMTIAAGGTASVSIAFTQTTVPAHTANETNYTDHTGDGAAISGSLTIASNDATTPSRVIGLAGYYQQVGNNNEEPSLQTIINRLGGYTTNLGLTNGAVDLTEGHHPDVLRGRGRVRLLGAGRPGPGRVRPAAGGVPHGREHGQAQLLPVRSPTSTHQLLESTAAQAQTCCRPRPTPARPR